MIRVIVVLNLLFQHLYGGNINILINVFLNVKIQQ